MSVDRELAVFDYLAWRRARGKRGLSAGTDRYVVTLPIEARPAGRSLRRWLGNRWRHGAAGLADRRGRPPKGIVAVTWLEPLTLKLMRAGGGSVEKCAARALRHFMEGDAGHRFQVFAVDDELHGERERPTAADGQRVSLRVPAEAYMALTAQGRLAWRTVRACIATWLSLTLRDASRGGGVKRAGWKTRRTPRRVDNPPLKYDPRMEQ